MLDTSGRTTITNFKQISLRQATYTIKNKTNKKVTYHILPGSINKPDNPQYQDTVVVQEKIIELNPNEERQQKLNTACYNLGKSSPVNEYYVVTKIRDPEIKAGDSQQTIWHEKVQKKLPQKSKEQVKSIISKITQQSQNIFQLINSQKIELHDVDYADGKIILIMDDPTNKGYYFQLPDDNLFRKNHLKQIQQMMGKDYIPGSVIRSETGKIQIQYKTQFDVNQYFQKIDVVHKKQRIKAAVDKFFYKDTSLSHQIVQLINPFFFVLLWLDIVLIYLLVFSFGFFGYGFFTDLCSFFVITSIMLVPYYSWHKVHHKEQVLNLRKPLISANNKIMLALFAFWTIGSVFLILITRGVCSSGYNDKIEVVAFEYQ